MRTRAIMGGVLMSGAALATSWSVWAQQPKPANPKIEYIRDPSKIVDPPPNQGADPNAEKYPTPPKSLIKVPDASFKPPTEPVHLKYRLDRPLRYLVRGYHRQAVKGREDLKQLYKSSSVVQYRPLTRDEALPPGAWIEEAPKKDAPKPTGTPVLVSVEKAYGGFSQPALLKETERTHQILRQAVLSYHLQENGVVSGLKVHQPTNPLARSSMSQMSKMAEHMQPVLPDRPIKPGDTWTQTVKYRDTDKQTRFSQDVTNTYTFDRWRRCGQDICAFITIKQDLRVAARLDLKPQKTDASGAGGGEGWILFDHERGEVYKASWKLTSQGVTRATVPTKGGDPKTVEAEVLVEVEVTSTRINVKK